MNETTPQSEQRALGMSRLPAKAQEMAEQSPPDAASLDAACWLGRRIKKPHAGGPAVRAPRATHGDAAVVMAPPAGFAIEAWPAEVPSLKGID